jgi:hypothetical protein
MDEEAQLREDISVTMEQVMESLGGGTMMIPDEVQRGLDEMTNPRLDAEGLRALLDDLRKMLR